MEGFTGTPHPGALVSDLLGVCYGRIGTCTERRLLARIGTMADWIRLGGDKAFWNGGGESKPWTQNSKDNHRPSAIRARVRQPSSAGLGMGTHGGASHARTSGGRESATKLAFEFRRRDRCVRKWCNATSFRQLPADLACKAQRH